MSEFTDVRKCSSTLGPKEERINISKFTYHFFTETTLKIINKDYDEQIG